MNKEDVFECFKSILVSKTPTIDYALFKEEFKAIEDKPGGGIRVSKDICFNSYTNVFCIYFNPFGCFQFKFCDTDVKTSFNFYHDSLLPKLNSATQSGLVILSELPNNVLSALSGEQKSFYIENVKSLLDG